MPLPTFLDYCRKIWNTLPATTKHWARDQIVWPPIMTAALTLLGAFVSESKVNWRVFRAGLLLYVIVFITFGLFQFIRAGWRAYQERELAIDKKDKELSASNTAIDERNLKNVEISRELSRQIGLANRLQKELDTARVALINANDKLEFLTWPDNRPKISFYSWGRLQSQFIPGGTSDPALLAQHGFYLANDGGAALEITVESFQITDELIAIGGTLARIEANDKGFVPVWIKDEVNLSKYALDIALEHAWQENAAPVDLYTKKPLEFSVSVIYRDYEQLWYRSRCTLIFTYELFHKNRIEFGPVEQEKCGISRPVLRQY